MKRKSRKRHSGKQSTDAADAAGKKRGKRTINDADSTATCCPIPGGKRKSSKGQQQGLQVILHHYHHHLHLSRSFSHATSKISIIVTLSIWFHHLHLKLFASKEASTSESINAVKR